MNDKEALCRLMKFFYQPCKSDSLEWSYVEGVSIGQYDEELENYLRENYGHCYD